MIAYILWIMIEVYYESNPMNKFCDYAHDVGSVAKFNIFLATTTTTTPSKVKVWLHLHLESNIWLNH